MEHRRMTEGETMGTQDRNFVESSRPPTMDLGLAEASRVGKHVFVSGQYSVDEAGRLVHPGDLAAQFEKAFGNVVSVVERAGGSSDEVVSTLMLLTAYPDEKAFVRICEIHKGTFGGANRPTGTMVYVPRLPVAGAMVEVSAVAVLD
jgi:enamine deaminase RidA (YjgF/YER057c/UK114 family)